MTDIELVRGRQRLDNLFARIGALGGDIELQSHWARYLCVLVSGYLETSVRRIYSEYARTRAAENVADYVYAQLSSFQNPKMEKILELTGSFSREWADDLKVATEGEQKDAVDSIVANRHRIAHGESVGITYATMRRYYENAVRVVELIEQQCAA